MIPPIITSETIDRSPWAHAIFSGESLELRHCNSAFAHWLNHKTADLPPSLRFPDVLAPNSRAEFHRSILSHAKVFSSWEGPLFMLTLSGEHLQVYACIISFRTAAGEDLCAFCASSNHLTTASSEISNISDHELLHALLEAVPMGIYFKDLKSRFIRVSDYQARKHNFPDANEMVGLSDFDIFSSEHAQPAFVSEQAIIASKQALIDIEEKETYTDQTDTWVSTSKFPLSNRAGQIVGTFGLSKDITIQHHLANEQSRITEELTRLKDRAALTAHIPQILKGHAKQAQEGTEDLKQSFNKLLPLLTSYRHLVQTQANGEDSSTALQESLQAEAASSPDELLVKILNDIQRNLDGISQLQAILDTLESSLAANPAQQATRQEPLPKTPVH